MDLRLDITETTSRCSLLNDKILLCIILLANELTYTDIDH
jgi:hypothetical protein